MSELKITMEAARRNKGLTQEGVAKKLSITRDTYRKFETGISSPTIEMAARFASLVALPMGCIDFSRPKISLKAIQKRKNIEIGDLKCK